MKAPVEYVESFLDELEAGRWFDQLWNGLAWERRPDAPRREYWQTTLGQPYTYGRGRGVRTYQPSPAHPVIELARARLLERTATLFQGCFLNGYQDNQDHLGWHADDDPGIDHSKPIAIITVGQPRAIQFKEAVKGNQEHEEVLLGNGSLCLMGAGMQQTHLHRIPKAGYVAKPRISLTFRAMLEPSAN